MKTIKILGVSVAALGVAASVGGAIALYTKSADPVGFGIGAGTYSGKTGAVTYKVNGNTSGSVAPIYYSNTGSGTGLSSDYTQVKYEFALSADFAQDLNEQNYVMGNISLSISNIPAKYQGKLAIWAGIEGYHDDTYGKTAFASALMSEDYQITSEQASYSGNANISVKSSGGQSLVVYMKYAVESFDLLSMDEESLGYTLSVNWGEPTNSDEIAYVVGTGNGWAVNEDFAMAINIEATEKEWTYNNLVADDSWSKGKCRLKGSEVWSIDPDATLESGKTYDVYWKGADTLAYFNARA